MPFLAKFGLGLLPKTDVADHRECTDLAQRGVPRQWLALHVILMFPCFCGVPLPDQSITGMHGYSMVPLLISQDATS